MKLGTVFDLNFSVAESGTSKEGIGYNMEEMTRLKTIVYNRRAEKVWADL